MGEEAVVAKVWGALAAEFIILAVLLFGGAGTVQWPSGWAFLALSAGLAVLITHDVAKHDPDLLQERLKVTGAGQPIWDRILLPVVLVSFFAWVLFLGADTHRLGGPEAPLVVQGLGAVAVVIGLAICWRVFRANSYLAPTVRHQSERQHTLVSIGPYAVVRHPLYSGGLLFLLGTPLMLGSWRGLAGAALIIAIIGVRTALEDKALHGWLEGYPDYARRVRFRLVPGVW